MSAKHQEYELLERTSYAPMDGLSRCLHLAEFDRCSKRGAMIAHKLSSKIVDTNGVGKILWFSPSVGAGDHNKYGNVVFNMSMQDLNCEFNFNFYYIDRLKFRTHVCTRLLFTENEYSEFDTVDFSECGSPLKRNRWRYATVDSGIPHEVEIAIEANKATCEWLFENSTISAVDHSRANSRKRTGGFKANVCHRFNMFGLPCPSPYSAIVTQNEMDTRYYCSDSE